MSDPERRLPVARAWLAEVLGTALLASSGLAATALASRGLLPEAAARSLAPGLTLLSLIYMLSDVSGAHFNPAVTLAFALRGSFPWRRVPGYLAAQLVGALAGGALLAALLPLPGFRDRGAAGGMTAGGVTGLELTCTAVLVLVILATATRKATLGPQTGLAVGSTLALCSFTAGSLAAVTLNPAVTLAQLIGSGGAQGAGPHLLGPLLGSAVAAGLTWALRGPEHPDEETAAQGEEPRPGR